jgi:hypothetical protein
MREEDIIEMRDFCNRQKENKDIQKNLKKMIKKSNEELKILGKKLNRKIDYI